MNPTEIYQHSVLPKKVDESQLEEAKKIQENLEAWKNWKLHPQTQEFGRILTQEKYKRLEVAMRGNGLQTTQILIEANTIDKILNSVMINGIYETPQ